MAGVRQSVTVGVPCWAAMWVRPVSTPITARHRGEHVDRFDDGGSDQSGQPQVGERALARASGDHRGLHSLPPERTGEFGPALRRPPLGGPVRVGHEEDELIDVGARPGREGIGFEKSASTPKSPPIRSRISLIDKGP